MYNNSQKLPGQGKNQQICDYERPPSPGKVCAVDVNSQAWGPCTCFNNYSYPAASPCVFIKLNRVSMLYEFHALWELLSARVYNTRHRTDHCSIRIYSLIKLKLSQEYYYVFSYDVLKHHNYAASIRCQHMFCIKAFSFIDLKNKFCLNSRNVYAYIILSIQVTYYSEMCDKIQLK